MTKACSSSTLHKIPLLPASFLFCPPADALSSFQAPLMVPSSSSPSFPYPPSTTTANLSPNELLWLPPFLPFSHIGKKRLPNVSSPNDFSLMSECTTDTIFSPMNKSTLSTILSPVEKTLNRQLGHHECLSLPPNTQYKSRQNCTNMPKHLSHSPQHLAPKCFLIPSLAASKTARHLPKILSHTH